MNIFELRKRRFRGFFAVKFSCEINDNSTNLRRGFFYKMTDYDTELYMEALRKAGDFAHRHGLRKEFAEINRAYKELLDEIALEEPAWNVTIH